MLHLVAEHLFPAVKHHDQTDEAHPRKLPRQPVVRQIPLVLFTRMRRKSPRHRECAGAWVACSIKVPFLATHPGVIPEGIVQSPMVSEHDFMPTLLEYVGLPLPDTNLAGTLVSCRAEG